MKIGIFGGTFNPPHVGHRRLADGVADALGLDKVIVIPSCIPPHKMAGSLVSGKDRLEMCTLAFDSPRFEISDTELKRGNKSYTVDTLRELRRIYPDDELYFMVGSDMLETFTGWYRWEEILSLAYLAAASREKGFRADLSGFTAGQREKIIFLDIEPFELSSTQLRAALRNNSDCAGLLDEKVADYIRSNKLYDDGFDTYREMLAKLLDPHRLYHSECVSESAGLLAKMYGADEEKAKLAGLLHDVTKCMTPAEQLLLIENPTALELKNHKVWHQMTGPVFLKKNNLVDDEEILTAIRWHTTGRAGMSLMEKIVYTADFISADRDYPDVGVVRKLADISLEHAMLYTSRYTINSLTAKDRPVHPSTVDCYNDMLKHFEL